MNAPRRFERHYCDKCMRPHWVEIIGINHVCLGGNYMPKDSPTHYTRWKYGGIELIEKMPKSRAMLEWKMAQEAREEMELALLNQDW